jgi:hypothetical protein
MVDPKPSPEPTPQRPRYDEYISLRNAGVLPADIAASWRLEQAGVDLTDHLVQRFASTLDLTPASVRAKLSPELVLNLGRLADQIGRAIFHLGFTLQGIHEDQNIFDPCTPFQGIAEARKERVERDPSKGHVVSETKQIRLDVAPLCAKMIEQLGILEGVSLPSDAPLKRLSLSVTDLLDTPLVEARNSTPISVRQFAHQVAECEGFKRSDDFVEDVFGVLESPLDRVPEILQLSRRIAQRGDSRFAQELAEKVPPELRIAGLFGTLVDPNSLSTEMKSAVIELGALVVHVEGALDVLERAHRADLQSKTDPYAGRLPSTKETIERAREERMTHDVGVQRRVAELVLFEHVDPRDYEKSTPTGRAEFKQTVEELLTQRLNSRRATLEKLKPFGVLPALQHQGELVERAAYELRCFRLNKAQI